MKKILTLCLLLFVTTAHASDGIPAGELFGYKLGDTYKITKKTRGSDSLGVLEVIADSPVKPKEIDEVRILITYKTQTIINIYGVKAFAKKDQANEFAWKYNALLSKLYPDARQVEVSLHDRPPEMERNVGNKLLSVGIFPSLRIKGKHEVHIGLKLDSESVEGKRLNVMAKAEGDQLMLESAKITGALNGIK